MSQTRRAFISLTISTSVLQVAKLVKRIPGRQTRGGPLFRNETKRNENTPDHFTVPVNERPPRGAGLQEGRGTDFHTPLK